MIHYYSPAANQNNPQYNFNLIYYNYIVDYFQFFQTCWKTNFFDL